MASNSDVFHVINKLNQLGRNSCEKSLYRKRLTANIYGQGRLSRQSSAWNALIVSILTTQQRSTGKSNLTGDLLKSGNLHWSKVKENPEIIGEYVKGFNYNNKKQKYLKCAVSWLNRNWEEVKLHQRNILKADIDDWEARYKVECDAARFLQGVTGIGLKQGRNFWQYRGYSVWTIPLDSRIRTILSAKPFSISIGDSYKNEAGYKMIERKVIELCRQVNFQTYPCMLDASLFNLDGLVRGYVGLPMN